VIPPQADRRMEVMSIIPKILRNLFMMFSPISDTFITKEGYRKFQLG